MPRPGPSKAGVVQINENKSILKKHLAAINNPDSFSKLSLFLFKLILNPIFPF